MQSDAKYWFPSKRYGWGWGPPVTWQGWLVFATFFAMILAGVFLFPPRQMLIGYLVYIGVLAVALLGVCWLKGEPPRWRWGKEDGTEASR